MILLDYLLYGGECFELGEMIFLVLLVCLCVWGWLKFSYCLLSFFVDLILWCFLENFSDL